MAMPGCQQVLVMVMFLSLLPTPQAMRKKRSSQVEQRADCPPGYKGCFKVADCVYIPKGEYAKLEEFPELLRFVGKCAHKNEILARVAPGIELESEEPYGETVRVKTKRANSGNRWIELASLCGEEQAWTSSQCANLCPLEITTQDECVARRGCVFVEADNVLPHIPAAFQGALGPTFGKCVAANGLIGSSPVQSEWISIAADDASEGLRVASHDGRKLLAFPEIEAHDGDDLINQECVLGEDADAYNYGSAWPANNTNRKSNTLQACQCHYWRHVKNMGEVKEVTTNFHYAATDADNFLLIDYGCWRNVLSKSLRMPVQFEYVASADKGNHERLDVFALDTTDGLSEWQPPMWSRSDKYGKPYDVGHLVMANHFDSYSELIHATNLMTNVLPQLGDMNRFAWLSTEYITECAREGDQKENVHVVGGCVWPENPDYIEGFDKMWEANAKKGHAGGYRLFIPDFCWKVLSAPTRGHVAFYIPNTIEAKISKVGSAGPDGVERGLTALSQFVVSLSKLERLLSTRQTPQNFTLPSGSQHDKDYTPTAKDLQDNGWSLNCDKK